MEHYEILEEYIQAQREKIDCGEPVVVEVRNTETFERLIVSAVIAPPGVELEDGQPLVLRDLAENVAADDWKIKIVEELDPASVDIQPESDFRKSAPDGA